MSNYQTLNPVPSLDPRDLDDNATVFDKLLNSQTSSELDRLGRLRKTYHQMELDAEALVSPNVAALAALTAASDKGIFFSSTLAMGTYTLSTFVRSLGSNTDAATFRAAIGALDSDDNAASATKLFNSRTIAATGDVTWSVSFDGSGNVSGSATLSNTEVTPGTYTRVTVDAKGRVVAGQSTALGVANGGTGSSTAAAARTALGVAFTAWANLTLQNSWAVVGSRLARYRSFLDMVCLEVNIQGGTITDGTVLFTLPAGSRPPNAQTIPVASSPASTAAAAKVLINPDGTVACYNCTGSPGISFSTTFATV